jgi:hypothetical protein
MLEPEKSGVRLRGALFAANRLMLASAMNRRARAASQLSANNQHDQGHAHERGVCGMRAEFQLAPANCSAEELRAIIARNVMVWIGSRRPSDSVETSAHERL